MWEFVHRFATERGINSFDDLERLEIDPTTKQRKAIAKRVERKKNPLPFDRAWTDKFVGDKFGQATTHWDKLMARVNRGVGNPCPLVLLGLPASIVSFEPDAPIIVDEAVEEAENDDHPAVHAI